jgi:hypothetical protein
MDGILVNPLEFLLQICAETCRLVRAGRVGDEFTFHFGGHLRNTP